jgi:ABC-type sugar transport system permease subunit
MRATTTHPRPIAANTWTEPRFGHFLKTLRRSRAAYLLLLPFLIHFVVVVAYPFLYSIYLSFFEAGLNEKPTFVGLRNFTTLLRDAEFHQALRNTFYFAVFVVIGDAILPLVLALVMNANLRARAFFRTAFFLPVITSWVVVSIIWTLLFARQGIINTLLHNIGLPTQPFLADGTQAMWIIIALSIWKNLGYYMVIYLAGLQGISQDLYDAAAVDGCDRWRSIWHVALPGLRPVIYFVVSISLIGSMQLFTQPFIMTNGGPLNATLSVVQLLYRKSFVELQFGYGSAIATVLLLILVVLSLANKKANDYLAS